MHLLLLYFEGQVAHMTKTNTTQVIDEYPPTRAGKAPPLPDHARSIPGSFTTYKSYKQNPTFRAKGFLGSYSLVTKTKGPRNVDVSIVLVVKDSTTTVSP